MSPFALLMTAIAIEVAATSVLPKAEGFSNAPWTVAVATGYLVSIWLLTLVVKRMDVSIAYAIWAGLGTAAVAVVGYLWLGEGLGVTKLGGIALIVAGVVLVNLQGVSHA
ncbi:MAG: multidrug efflux SMR transporter [Solirubrobacteraceae bacterium]|nr:multidrug efflux SMR transporter [Solirubrobacteraceae bacterium]